MRLRYLPATTLAVLMLTLWPADSEARPRAVGTPPPVAQALPADLASPARPDDRFLIRVVIEGAVAMVPEKPLGQTGRYQRVWALVPRAWDDAILRRVNQAGFQPPLSNLPLHHPILSIPARNLVGAGDSAESVMLYLNSANPRVPPRNLEKAAYDIALEPFEHREEAVVGNVSFNGRDLLPTVYQQPPTDEEAGQPTRIDARALMEKPPADLPLAARMRFDDGETLVAEPIAEAQRSARFRFAHHGSCTPVAANHVGASVYDCAEAKTVGKASEMAQAVVATRWVVGDQLLVLRDLAGGAPYRYHLTAEPGEVVEIRLANLTAEDILGLPVRHAHGGPQVAIEHFVLLYGLAEPGGGGVVQPPYWYPVLDSTAGPGRAVLGSNRSKNGRPWCSTPGIFELSGN